jgi:hypothetical protein
MADEKINLDAPGCFFCLNVKPFVRKAWSDATKDHFRSARVEFLKGVRSVIDDRINSMGRHEVKGTHVTVE